MLSSDCAHSRFAAGINWSVDRLSVKSWSQDAKLEAIRAPNNGDGLGVVSPVDPVVRFILAEAVLSSSV